MDGEEWNTAAVGPTKRRLAASLLARGAQRVGAGRPAALRSGQVVSGRIAAAVGADAATGAPTACRCGATRRSWPTRRRLRATPATRGRAVCRRRWPSALRSTPVTCHRGVRGSARVPSQGAAASGQRRSRAQHARRSRGARTAAARVQPRARQARRLRAAAGARRGARTARRGSRACGCCGRSICSSCPAIRRWDCVCRSRRSWPNPWASPARCGRSIPWAPGRRCRFRSGATPWSTRRAQMQVAVWRCAPAVRSAEPPAADGRGWPARRITSGADGALRRGPRGRGSCVPAAGAVGRRLRRAGGGDRRHGAALQHAGAGRRVSAAARSAASTDQGDARPGRDRGERAAGRQLARARRQHDDALRAGAAEPSGHREVHARRPSHGHGRRQPHRARRTHAGRQSVSAAARSAQELRRLLAESSVAVVPVLRRLHRPDEPGAARGRDARRRGLRAGDRDAPASASPARPVRRGWSIDCSAICWWT